jgi:hypothetical protein
MDMALLLEIPAVVLLILVVVGLTGFLRGRVRQRDLRDYEAERQASIELHRIGTRLEAARARAEIHRDAETLKDRLAEALNDYRT